LRIINTLFHVVSPFIHVFFYRGGSVSFTSAQMVSPVLCMMTSMALK
jgi:hypothetical protein